MFLSFFISLTRLSLTFSCSFSISFSYSFSVSLFLSFSLSPCLSYSLSLSLSVSLSVCEYAHVSVYLYLPLFRLFLSVLLCFFSSFGFLNLISLPLPFPPSLYQSLPPPLYHFQQLFFIPDYSQDVSLDLALLETSIPGLVTPSALSFSLSCSVSPRSLTTCCKTRPPRDYQRGLRVSGGARGEDSWQAEENENEMVCFHITKETCTGTDRQTDRCADIQAG